MELYNSTLYNYQAIINGVSYDLKSRSSIFFDYGNEWKDELTAVNGTPLGFICTCLRK